MTIKEALVETSTLDSNQHPSLPSCRYVRPYVSEITNQEPTTSPRLSTLEDLKTLSDVPTAVPVTVTPAAKPKHPCHTLKYADIPKSRRSAAPRSSRTDVTSEHADASYIPEMLRNKGASKEHIQDALRHIKQTIAAQYVNTQGARLETQSEEAPVPHSFSARDHCRAERTGDLTGSIPRRAQAPVAPSTGFFIYCNKCDTSIPDAHWHCSICDNGDFDLCLACVSHGITCNDSQHWLIKRTVNNGLVVSSTTETIHQKEKAKVDEPKIVPGAFVKPENVGEPTDLSRTCNSCVQGMSLHDISISL